MKIVHGGDLDFVVREYGIRREDIRDFSGNINPLGLSERARQAIIDNVHMVTTYPDSKYLSLKGAINKYTGAKAENIIVGNGSTELISLYIKNYVKRGALIVAPAYSEYEREIRLQKGECKYFELKEADDFVLKSKELFLALEDTDMLIICNPNNPTGTAVAAEEMDSIASFCCERGIKILVDETYCEFSDTEKFSSIGLVEKYDNLMVIRGIAKFFAAPGLRLGYGIASVKIIEEISKHKDPWTVNTLAVAAGEQFFSDRDYIEKTKSFIAEEKNRMFDELSKLNSIKLYRSEANFQLFRLTRGKLNAGEIFERLIVKGLMIRDAGSFVFLDESYIRYCIRSREDNDMLLKELKDLL